MTTQVAPELRRTLGDPTTILYPAHGEPDDYDFHPGEDAVHWDLGGWANIVIGPDMDDPARPLYITSNTKGGHESRAVTPAQVRSYAAQLLALADRHDNARAS